ncbi:Vacuolar cation/proton exchanger 3 [Glycine max]|nr:Vacuolar cation/proton exchanger 3 [Glycine max]
MASFSHMQSQLQSQMQSQGIVVPPDPLVGPSSPRVSIKGICVDPLGNDPETGDSNRCGLYIEADPARLVAMGRVYEGSTIVHNTPLLPGHVKVSVEEVTDADAPVPIPTDEVSLVGQALLTFLAWPTHLVKSLSQQVLIVLTISVSPAKPPPKPNPEVDDPLYLMTLTIPELFLRPYQVRWDATVFRVFNPDFPLHIKHEDLSEIAHGGQCLSISVLQLWILHLTETCMRVGNFDIYGFLEPQSIQRSGQSQFKSESYIKSWMQSSQRDVYLGAYLNGPDNYLKGIINSALKGLDDAPQPKSKASARWIVVKCNRQKGSTECGYYVMHWMSTIILGTFKNNWEASWVFVLSLLGLTPLAERVSFLTEQVAYYTGPAGVYGSTAVLLKQSVLEVLHNRQANMNLLMLFVALLCHLLPLLLHYVGASASDTADSSLQLSRAASIVMDAFDSWGLFVSFLSIILLPIVGNATEHVGAIIFGFKNKLDISLGVSLGSSTQISMFVVPLCVIVAWIMGIKMDLNFNFLETRSLALAIIITTFILHD